MIKYKQGKSNVVADALSIRHTMLNFLNTQYLGFDHIKETYKDDLGFSRILQECSKGAHKDFFFLEEGRVKFPTKTISSMKIFFLKKKDFVKIFMTG